MVVFINVSPELNLVDANFLIVRKREFPSRYGLRDSMISLSADSDETHDRVMTL